MYDPTSRLSRTAFSKIVRGGKWCLMLLRKLLTDAVPPIELYKGRGSPNHDLGEAARRLNGRFI